MGINKKIIIILFFTIATAFATVVLFTRVILLNNFLDLEEAQVYRNIDRFNNVLAQEIIKLQASALDYGAWDESYTYAKGENSNYIEKNFSESIFSNFRINYIFYFDIDGNNLYARSYDFIKGIELETPLEFKNISAPVKLFLAKHDSVSAQTGFMIIDKKPVLLIAQPILNNLQEGPAAGTILFGRILSAEEIKFFEDYVHFKIEFINIQEFNRDFSDNSFVQQALNKNSSAYFRKSDQIINGFILIKNINNEPVMVASVILPRDIYQTGNKIIKIFLFIFPIAGIILILIIFILLKLIVISRLKKISEQVKKASNTADFSEKIIIKGRDEVYALAEDINKMTVVFNNLKQDLINSKQRLEDVSENALDWIWETDKKGKIKYSNQAIEKILGYRADETIGKYFYDFAGKDSRADIKAKVTEIFDRGKPFRKFFKKIKSKDGKAVWLSSNGAPMFNKEKEIIGFRGVDKDITELKKAEEDLIDKNKELENINKMAIGRELKMIELKEKIKKIEEQRDDIIPIVRDN